MSTQFDLEQQIMGTWNVVDDLKLFREILDSKEFKGIPPELSDKINNYILALVTIYQYKFDKTFATFEKYISENRSGNPY
jgi:hypothetical protein